MSSTTATLFAPHPSPVGRVAAFARLVVVLIAHALLLGAIASHLDVVPPKPPQTIEVALIAPPAPVPVAPPKVETPPAPPKPVEPPPPPVVRKVEIPKPRVAPKPRPQPKKAITEPTPAPEPAVEAPPEPPVVTTPTPPVAAAPAPAPTAAPQPVVAARFDAAYLNNPRPGYPRLSRRLGEQGTVQLRVRVSADGKAEEVQLHQSSGFKRLDDAARTAVAHWRFVPAKQGDKSIATWVIVPIEFKLEDA